MTRKINIISDKTFNFLLSEKSPTWTWNYFSKETQKKFPALHYPDDNDDTFIVLSALLLHDKESRAIETVARHDFAKSNGKVLATITKNLMKTGVTSGGPYKTWYTNVADEKWQDVDIAVNANIAHFLSLKGIRLPNLEKFFVEKLKGDFKSPYYPSEIPLLYFISKSASNYSNESEIRKLLLEKINNYLKKEKSERTLMNKVLCLSSLVRLGAPREQINTLRDEVLDQCKKEGCQVEPFCLDPERNGVTYFCGSKSLTASFVIEALSLCRETKGYYKKDKSRIEVAIKRAEEFLPTHVIQNALGKLEKEIILYPFILTNTLRVKVTSVIYRTSDDLAYANLIGWVAYKIIDDIIDEGKSRELLPLANKALREVNRIYFTILKKPEHQKFFKEIMDDMDDAQREEMENVNSDEEVMLQRLGRKSLGHALPTIVLVLLSKQSTSSATMKSVVLFWKNYLTAKQLSDDAHDWKDDFKKGIPNSTLFYIRNSKHFKKEKASDLSHLNEIFWDETMTAIAEKIQAHADVAMLNIKRQKCFKNIDFFSEQIEKIKRDAQNAIKERKEILEYQAHMGQ